MSGHRPIKRRESSQCIVPGEAAEDGDFVRLREIRQQKVPVSYSSNKEKLTTISESQEVPRKVSHSEISVHQLDSRVNSAGPVRMRDELFELVSRGSSDELKTKLESLPTNTRLTDHVFLQSETRQNLLHYALENNKREISKMLIQSDYTGLLGQEYGVFLGSITGKKNALHKITELNDLEMAKLFTERISDKDLLMKLLLQETPVTISGQRPRTFPCVHLAAFHGFTEMAELFLDCDVDVNHINQKKDTALLWAARWGHVTTVKMLLNRKALTDMENDKGSTALYWAVRYGFSETVELLAREGKANVNKTRKLGLVAPVIVASAYGMNDIVTILLSNGADVNFCIRGRERPIHHAAREGHTDVILTLLSHGARIDEADERGDTSLILAAKFGHPFVLQTLVKHGADMNHKNHEGDDVWSFAVDNESDDVIRVLIDSLIETGAMVMEDGVLCFSRKKSPLLQAAAGGHCDKVEMLLQLKLDPLARDDEGNNLMHYAAINNRHAVIRKFSDRLSVDLQNERGNTPLHISAIKGHHDTIVALLERNAKANVKNESGETALHVAASSQLIEPRTVKQMFNYVIKSHAHESLNVVNNDGNNPLHVAAQFAKPDVLWEFRFVRLKDKGQDGNTPLHAAVRPGEPDVLDMMLDIYESMKRDADINEQNNRKEGIIHLAASQGFTGAVRRLILYGANLAFKDHEGNTVLHSLTKSSVADPARAKQHVKMFEMVTDEAVKWWCMERGLQYPDDHDLYSRYKRQAVLSLTIDLYNNADLNVLATAYKVGAVDIVKMLMMMKGVMCFEVQNKVRFNVTHLTPLTNNSLTGFCNNTRVIPRPSCIEWLLSLESTDKASEILDIPPIKLIEKAYGSVAAWTNIVLIILHIAYMATFSYCSNALLERRRISPSDYSVDAPTVLLYAVVPIEPALFLFYVLYRTIKSVCMGQFTVSYKLHIGRDGGVVTLIETYISILFSFVYAILVVVWIVLFSVGYSYHDYFLAPSLLLGWLFTISFTRGFKLIHYFWKMIQHMIIKDVLKFLFVYLFVLLAFSFCVHVLFQVSPALIANYASPLDTMFLFFNLMIGMGELFDGSVATSLQAVGRSTLYIKILYIIYMILGTIVLLNLLIAMMNDSYSDILRRRQLGWRIESVQLGVDIEKSNPWCTKLFSRVKLHYGQILPSPKDKADMNWYIEVSRDLVSVDQTKSELSEIEAVRDLNSRIKNMENRMTDQLKQMQTALDEIRGVVVKLKLTKKQKD
ncbi:uncharacterized protein LOC121384979 [Gigantopelta aegis]|uniref:uncharacterized protein LOC121384979 n=1 Tax=Gigantopelta aegis TaxID=1735272 RepID=UPI001B889688|nr:uncharacterized protein LOC121384979 [Gigantopelta aegis]